MKTETITLHFLFLLLTFNTFSQTLIKADPNTVNNPGDVIAKYEYAPAGSHDVVNLTLFKNGKYSYEEHSMAGSLFNEGKWKQVNNKLILRDGFDRDNLPIVLTCQNKTDTGSTFKIQVIRNLKGEYLTDGLVYINNDSTQCLPLTGTCLKAYEKVDSIKVVFENGLKSGWIPVPCGDAQQLLLILQSNLLLSNYTVLKNYRFRKISSRLIPM